MVNALRGMKDTLPPDNEKFMYFVENASRIAKNYGFNFVQTPILEETALFKRSVGESSDIVGKEMYQFIDKGENDVCMRPEGTAGVVRAFVENKLDRAGGTHRWFYYGPMYRYERPQKGRLRQFHQFGAESFGEASYLEDATIIKLIADIFDFFSISYHIKLNSLGCPQCMPHYKEKLITFLKNIETDLCDDCKRRISTNPLRVLDCKVEKCQSLLCNAPLLSHHLCSTCETEIEGVKNVLNRHKLPFEMDSKLVRGLDYYSKTAFEFTSDAIGSQSAIAGGGRYDRLVEFLEGKPTPAIGFAIGIERIFDLITPPQQERQTLYVGSMVQEANESLFDLVLSLRKHHKVHTVYETKSLKAHLKNSDKADARYALIIGEDEWKENKIWIKDLVTKEDKIILITDVIENFSKGVA